MGNFEDFFFFGSSQDRKTSLSRYSIGFLLFKKRSMWLRWLPMFHFYFPMTITQISLSALPFESKSQKSILCQVPKFSFPPLKLHSNDSRIMAAFRWALA